jgi:lysophospholipase L1-like esterase
MRFPVKTALAFATFILALIAWRQWGDRDRGIAPSIVAEAWQLRLHRTLLFQTMPVPQQGQSPGATETSPGKSGKISPVPSNYLFGDAGALDTFYGGLASLDGPATARPEHVSILHYGDSPTTADLVTGDVRALLQQRFGDAGHGYLLIDKPWAWYGHRDTDITGHDWTVATAVGKMHPDTYGIGGASFQGASDSATSHITLKDAAQSGVELAYLAQPEGGTVAITADNNAGTDRPLATITTGSDTRRPAWQTISLPPGTKAINITVAAGHVELFGETFEKRQRGILYNSLGLNGASTTVLSRGFDPDIWTTELRHDAPELIIINYGTNESSFASFVDTQYEGELRTAINRIRSALPNVSILVMSPLDRGERSGIDQIDTMATIPRIVAIQKRVASDTHCAFFDTFNAMGGVGTISRWYSAAPRLVSADLIHPTPQGALIIAQVFVRNLLRGYDTYKASRATASKRPKPKQAAQP